MFLTLTAFSLIFSPIFSKEFLKIVLLLLFMMPTIKRLIKNAVCIVCLYPLRPQLPKILGYLTCLCGQFHLSLKIRIMEQGLLSVLGDVNSLQCGHDCVLTVFQEF